MWRTQTLVGPRPARDVIDPRSKPFSHLSVEGHALVNHLDVLYCEMTVQSGNLIYHVTELLLLLKISVWTAVILLPRPVMKSGRNRWYGWAGPYRSRKPGWRATPSPSWRWGEWVFRYVACCIQTLGRVSGDPEPDPGMWAVQVVVLYPAEEPVLDTLLHQCGCGWRDSTGPLTRQKRQKL